MQPKSGLKKRTALRSMPQYRGGLRDTKPRVQPENPLSVMSMFCGCGGLDLGFLGGFEFLNKHYAALPFDVLQAVDIDARAVETYRLNIGEHVRVGDLTQIAPSELPAADVLIGGFPCQDFSSSGPKVGFSGDRGQLYHVLSAYMRQHRPAVVVGENVPFLATLHDGIYLREILRDFTSCGYRFTVWNLSAPDYGLPQSRRRLFLVGVRDDLDVHVDMPGPTTNTHVPIDAAIGDLVNVQDERIPNQSQYSVATPASKGGGQGDKKNCRGRLAYTIRANAKSRIEFHYELDRRLTVRECARLQSFPDEFVFPFAAQPNMMCIGNAVPPILAHAVAQQVVRGLSQYALAERGH